MIFYKNIVKKNIDLIFSGVRYPTTNGVVEAVHKDIKNSLLAEKLTRKKTYEINFPISNEARAHNTKNYLFNYNT